MQQPRHIMTALAAFVLASCSVGGYEAGEGSLSHMTAEYADITVHETKVTDIVTDADEHLRFSEELSVSGEMPTDTVIRRLLYYNKVETDAKVEILKSLPVAVVSPHEAAEMKVAKTDPVKLTSIWMAKNQRYINMQLGIMTGNDAPEDARQQLQFRRDSVSTQGKGRVFITLYHDQADVPQYYTQDKYLSIPMPQQDTITVRINTYSGVVERTLNR